MSRHLGGFARLSPFLLGAGVLMGSGCGSRDSFGSGFQSLLTSAATGTIETGTFSGRNYKLYVPTQYVSGTPIPLVLMLHGCTQDPDQFMTGTQMNGVAEANTFFALYPDEPSTVQSLKCWQWFDSANQARGGGEPAALAQLISTLSSAHSVDPNRVYVAGLSAGAAMAVVLGATYPDVFAAIAVGSGLEYQAGTTQSAGQTAELNGGPDPVAQGKLAYQAMGAHARVVPTLVFHGTQDFIVNVKNGNQVLSQWAEANDLASDGVDDDNINDTPASTATGSAPNGGRSYTHTTYVDQRTGGVVMEKYLVDGMGHAWSGGSSSGSFTDNKGPDASHISWTFFLQHPLQGGPVIPPSGTECLLMPHVSTRSNCPVRP